MVDPACDVADLGWLNPTELGPTVFASAGNWPVLVSDVWFR